jgi:hypothetical protein
MCEEEERRDKRIKETGRRVVKVMDRGQRTEGNVAQS